MQKSGSRVGLGKRPPPATGQIENTNKYKGYNCEKTERQADYERDRVRIAGGLRVGWGG